MRAMMLDAPHQPLRLASVAIPMPGSGQVLLRVQACAVCRTDLHVVDGELTQPKLPLVPGHEIIGTIAARGPGAERFALGDRVGVPWLGFACGVCEFCRVGRMRICACRRASPATRSMAVMPTTPSPTNASASRFRRRIRMWKRRH